MQLERLLTAADVARRAADLVAAVVRSRPEAVLVLPAGATPIPLYAEIVRRARLGALDLSRVQLFQLDELVGVAPEDERSFQAFFERHLLRPLGTRPRFHALDGRARDPAAEIEGHRRALVELGGADLALLGLGRNGHVAFNEPGSRASDPARVIELGASTLQALAAQFAQGAIPRLGITLGLREIAASRRVALLVTGASKAEILAEVVRGEPSSACPATWLARHPDFVVLADAEAARGLDRNVQAGSLSAG